MDEQAKAEFHAYSFGETDPEVFATIGDAFRWARGCEGHYRITELKDGKEIRHHRFCVESGGRILEIETRRQGEQT